MAPRLIWSPRAARQFEAIVQYIARDSPLYAKAFARRINHLVRLIPAHPEAGRMVPEYGHPDLRERIHQGYRIVYRLRPGTAEIAAICHGSRLIGNAIGEE